MKNILPILVLLLVAGASPARAAGPLGTLTGYAATADLPYRTPEASAPVDAQIYLVVVDGDGYFFTSEYACRAYGEKVAGTISKAGFQIMSQGARPWRDGAGNDYWEYRVEYGAPSGLITPGFKTHNLVSDNNGTFYQSRWEASAAGREARLVLAEAGYFVLNGWPRRIDSPSERWEYYIEYTAKSGRNTAAAAAYEVFLDKTGQRFTSGSDAAWAAKAFSDKIKAAGYFPLGSRLSAVDLDGRRYYSCYAFYIPRAGRAAPEIQYDTAETDENNNVFDWDYMASMAGESITKKLEAAGYVVLEARLVWQTAYRRWAYQNIYVAPSGYSSNKPQTYLLDKGVDGKPYSDYWGQQAAKSDGEAMAATLAAAGYTVLRGVTRPSMSNPGTWVHEITYIQPAK